jgi:magnesium-transporting ATPase (P-type)
MLHNICNTYCVSTAIATLTEVFPCFFLSCKANARVKPAKKGHGPHSSKFLCWSIYFLCCSMYFCVVLCIVCFVSFSVLFVCICVLYYCHRVATQLQLNVSYISYHIMVTLHTSILLYVRCLFYG